MYPVNHLLDIVFTKPSKQHKIERPGETVSAIVTLSGRSEGYTERLFTFGLHNNNKNKGASQIKMSVASSIRNIQLGQ